MKPPTFSGLRESTRDGSYFDHVYVNRVWLSDKNRNNAEISVTGKQTGRNMASGNYTYEFNMKEVPEGSYNVVINAQDTFNNTGNLPYQTVVVDNTAPSVSISYEGKPISKNVTVYGAGERPYTAHRCSN